MKKNSLYDIEYYQKIKIAQERKKKKVKVRRTIMIVIALIILVYLVSPLSKVGEISINGNQRYSDAEIKKIAGIHENQFNFLKPSFLVSSKLKNSKMFTSISVKNGFFQDMQIDIKENRLLFYTNKDKKIIFYDEKNNKIIYDGNNLKKYLAVVPELYSSVDKSIQDKLVEKLSELDESVTNEISQIIYMPKSYDKEFFRFVMSGEKKLYINANLDSIVKVGVNYHNFAANTKYKCSYIEYIDTENKAVVKKCK
ncbi:cell division protein FtsQ [Bacilli bacterium PM5-3]|nr:cell division protein FtsQ [Bacilli bacterium PM5-3]MDH6603230.1 cell division protein FtsQ [Bacilli bacterium PM5-9]